MSESDAGKGDRPRPIDKKAYDNSPLWNNWATKRKNQDIWDANKDKAIEMGIEVVKDDMD